MARRTLALSLVLVLITLTACVGPSKLRRGLDEQQNQFYVDNPLLAEAVIPITAVAMLVATAVDLAVVNPVFFWKDVMAGQGTPYYFRNPKVPMEDEEGS